MGVVGSLVVLLVLNRIGLDDPPASVAGKIVAQALPLSIGVSLANAVFSGRRGRSGEGAQQAAEQDRGAWKPVAKDVGATAIGAACIASSIAPTDEVPMLAGAMDYPHLLALVTLSLLLGYTIVFTSGFDPERHQTGHRGPFQRPLTETALAYLVAVVVSLGMLFLVQSIGPEDPPYYVLQQTLVFALRA